MEDVEAALLHLLEQPDLAVPAHKPLPTPEWLYEFCKETLGYDKMQPQPHYELCWELEQMVGDCKFTTLDRTAILVEMPRGNYKTTVASGGLPVGILTKNPNARGLIVTHKEKTSSRRLDEIKSHFEKNATFHKKCGNDWKPDHGEGAWSSKAILINRRTKIFREPSVEVASVGADMTGSHYDFIICDDVVQRENCRSQEQRDKVYEYIQSLFSLLDPGGVLIVIGTRWHPDDAYGRIIRKDAQREKSGLTPLFRKYIRSCYDGPNGLLFPAEYGHEQLEDILDRIGPTSFASNYLNQPVAAVDKVFKPEYLTERDFTYSRSGPNSGIIRYAEDYIPVYVTMAWDTAGTKIGAKSDYHGMTVRGTDHRGAAWALEAVQIKGTVSQIISKAVSMILYYRPEKILIESIGSWQLWVDKLNQGLAPFGVSLPILEAKHRGIPKEERIQMLEPDWVNRQIIVKPDQTDFKTQFDNFSMSSSQSHDDIIDSWAMHLGHTQTADEEYAVSADNPRDPEAMLRDSRRRGSSFGGRFITGRHRR